MTFNRYSEAFKRQVVVELEQGKHVSLEAAASWREVNKFHEKALRVDPNTSRSENTKPQAPDY